MLYYIFYKNQGKISDHHPVVKKMFYLRSIMQKMKSVDENVFAQVDKILKLIEEKKNLEDEEEIGGEDIEDGDEDIEDEDEDIEEDEEDLEAVQEILKIKNTGSKKNNTPADTETKFLNKKRTQEFIQENTERMKKLVDAKEKKQIKAKEDLIKEIDHKNQTGQRMANEGVLKSRGLYRKRKQYQGNAKLHNREKFFKKEKIRKNFVKEYQGKPEVYGGESTGIRRDLIRSTKFKS
jgi:U3 small nucleolar RNA-associated protein 3